MLALLKYWQIGAGAVAGAILAAGPLYLYGVHEGKQQAVAAQAIETAKSYKERAEINDKVESLDAIALCLQLGGLPDECTVELRGVAKDKGIIGDSRVPIKKRPASGAKHRVPQRVR